MATMTKTALRCSAPQPALAETLKLAAGFAGGGKDNSTAMYCAVLSAGDDGGLTVSATNGRTWCALRVDGASVATPGQVAVNARLLAEVTAQLPPDTVELDLDAGERRLNVRCGRSEAHMGTQDVGLWPPAPAIKAPHDRVTVDAEALTAALGRVRFAVSTDESRAILTGMLWELTGGGFDGEAVAPSTLTLAAADGFRLAVQRLPVDADGAWRRVIPGKVLTDVARLLGAQKGPVNVLFSEKHVRFDLVAWAVTAELVVGVFPNYAQLIPKSWTGRATMNTEALAAAARTAAVFADSSGPLRVWSDPAGMMLPPELHLSCARDDNHGAAGVEATTEGEPIRIAFTARYFRQAVEAAGGKRVVLETTSPSAPAVLRCEGDDHWQAVLMPLFVTWE